jgi:hypothetical protein
MVGCFPTLSSPWWQDGRRWMVAELSGERCRGRRSQTVTTSRRHGHCTVHQTIWRPDGQETVSGGNGNAGWNRRTNGRRTGHRGKAPDWITVGVTVAGSSTMTIGRIVTTDPRTLACIPCPLVPGLMAEVVWVVGLAATQWDRWRRNVPMATCGCLYGVDLAQCAAVRRPARGHGRQWRGARAPSWQQPQPDAVRHSLAVGSNSTATHS